MAKNKQVAKQKVKKKKWFPIYAPAAFSEQLIGESYLESIETLKGKYININLATMSNDMKKQHISVALRVNKVVDGKGYTEVIGFMILQSHLKRLVRRGRTKVDDSFTAKTSEGVLVRIKPLVMTNSNVTHSASTEIRSQTKAFFIDTVTKNNFNTLVEGILSARFQKELKSSLMKITPIRSVDVRVFERECVRGAVPTDELEAATPLPEKPRIKKTPQPQEEQVDEEPAADDAEE